MTLPFLLDTTQTNVAAIATAATTVLAALVTAFAKLRSNQERLYAEQRKLTAAQTHATTTQADVSAGALVLSQVTYLTGLIPALEAQVAAQAKELAQSRHDCEVQIAAVRAKATEDSAAKDRDIAALQQLTAQQALRLNKLDPGGATHA